MRNTGERMGMEWYGKGVKKEIEKGWMCVSRGSEVKLVNRG